MALEHRIPIWVILKLRLIVVDTIENMKIVNISLYACIKPNIVKNVREGDSLNKSTRPSKITTKNIANC